MFQFGYEYRETRSAGLLAIDGPANLDHALKLADDAHRFTDLVVIYTNANPTLAAEPAEALQDADIRVDDRGISRLKSAPHELHLDLSGDASIKIEFTSGEIASETFLKHRLRTRLVPTLSDQLGLKYDSSGQIQTAPPFCQTSREGIFAAGDCASMMKIIPNAISMGVYAGAGIARELPKRVRRIQGLGQTSCSTANGPM